MDRSDLTGAVAKLRAELAEISSQIIEYHSNKRHTLFEKKEHSERGQRIRQIQAELEAMLMESRKRESQRNPRDGNADDLRFGRRRT